MSVESEIRHLHVPMSLEDFALLSKWKGPKKWKPWLLSIPTLLREAADRAEKAELRLQLAERDKSDLEERCRRLQQMVEDE